MTGRPSTQKRTSWTMRRLLLILQDKKSQPLMTFITKWGRFMYLKMPQGYLASGDTCACRYDKMIKDIPCKVKDVDDTLLFDHNMECAFYHTIE